MSAGETERVGRAEPPHSHHSQGPQFLQGSGMSCPRVCVSDPYQTAALAKCGRGPATSQVLNSCMFPNQGWGRSSERPQHGAQGYSVTCTCKGDTGGREKKMDAEVSLGFCCLYACMKESSHGAWEEAELVHLFTNLISLKSAGIVFTKFHVLTWPVGLDPFPLPFLNSAWLRAPCCSTAFCIIFHVFSSLFLKG